MRYKVELKVLLFFRFFFQVFQYSIHGTANLYGIRISHWLTIYLETTPCETDFECTYPLQILRLQSKLQLDVWSIASLHILDCV